VRYAFRGQVAPSQEDSIPESSSLSDQQAVLCAADSGIGQQCVIQRKVSYGILPAKGAIWRARLLTVTTTTLRQQGRFLEKAWTDHHRGDVITSLYPDP
jgi:hypothetical protein